MSQTMIDATRTPAIAAPRQAAPVVLLHSSASCSAQWRVARERLGEWFPVLTPDLLGYGARGAWPGNGALRLSDEARVVADALAPCGAPVHLVGHSYGGAVALRFATQYPQSVRTLTLIEPVAFHLLAGANPFERELFAEVTELAEAVMQSVASGDYAGGAVRFVDYWSGSRAWLRLREENRAAISRLMPKVALDFHATMNETTPLGAYRKLRVPTLVLCGQDSPLVTYAIAERLAGAMPGARLEILGGVGHMAPVTHPEVVAAAIARYLLSDRAEQTRERAA